MRGDWIAWAFARPLPTAEKLVLVYLAAQVSREGIGFHRRPELEQATGYKKRSIQRLLKSLRDAGELQDEDGSASWYVLGDSALRDLPGAMPEPRPEFDVPAPDPFEVDGAGLDRAMYDRLIDAAEYWSDQLAQHAHRLSGEIDRLATAEPLHVEPEPPPPDPVLEDPRYPKLLDVGLPAGKAYLMVAEMQAAEGEEAGATRPNEKPADERGTFLAPDGGRDMPLTPRGRCQLVAEILGHGEVSDSDLRRWAALEESENKYSVKGETRSAFEQLYPAIVAAARKCGGMDLAEFTDPAKVAASRAPWDLDPEPTPAEDAILEAEIAQLLAELNAVNDPRCTVQPRTREKGEDGVTRTESIVGYHRRVKAKYQEMQKMKTMGILG